MRKGADVSMSGRAGARRMGCCCCSRLGGKAAPLPAHDPLPTQHPPPPGGALLAGLAATAAALLGTLLAILRRRLRHGVGAAGRRHHAVRPTGTCARLQPPLPYTPQWQRKPHTPPHLRCRAVAPVRGPRPPLGAGEHGVAARLDEPLDGVLAQLGLGLGVAVVGALRSAAQRVMGRSVEPMQGENHGRPVKDRPTEQPTASQPGEHAVPSLHTCSAAAPPSPACCCSKGGTPPSSPSES